jgi:hypothetical protein
MLLQIKETVPGVAVPSKSTPPLVNKFLTGCLLNKLQRTRHAFAEEL